MTPVELETEIVYFVRWFLTGADIPIAFNPELSALSVHDLLRQLPQWGPSVRKEIEVFRNEIHKAAVEERPRGGGGQMMSLRERAERIVGDHYVLNATLSRVSMIDHIEDELRNAINDALAADLRTCMHCGINSASVRSKVCNACWLAR